ncbi:AAA family ATPase [Streptomyces collinus]|uniref:AAA family ATPase n=1 Tax=Streptomyces collinus TaxID=42684 RepID=UPI0037D71B73
MSDWFIYRGVGSPDPDRIENLPEPPPWRRFSAPPVPYPVPDVDDATLRRLGHRSPVAVQDTSALELINAALYLRRPLLVTGSPGAGKSSLAHSIAYELGLGRVLQWPIVSRSELKDGLYTYDAIGRLQDVQIDGRDGDEVGRYIRLGPLGTALIAADRPRVLLIDELDKSDIDLPNDLLNVLEEGEFEIPELQRIADRPGQDRVDVLTNDGLRVQVSDGKVRCRAFPVVVMTSNGERDFPAALLRRCVSLHLDAPRDQRLAALVQAHFGTGTHEENTDLLELFATRDPGGGLRPTDQLLNAVFLAQHTAREDPDRRLDIADMLMRPLGHGPR